MRWNLLDVAAAIVLASVATVGVAGYRRFQAPAPEIVAVTPSPVVAGKARALSVRGRHFHPYLHFFVFAAGHTPAINALDPSTQEAKAVATTATTADVTLPPVTPGVYDLYVFDEFQQVALLPRAFTVLAPTYARAEMASTVRLFVSPGSASLLTVGERDRTTSPDPDVLRTDGALLTAVRVDPRVHEDLEMRIASGQPGDSAVWIGGRGWQQQVDLDLRVPLVQDAAGEWRYNGAPVRAGELLDIETARFKGRGTVIAVGDPHPLDSGARP